MNVRGFPAGERNLDAADPWRTDHLWVFHEVAGALTSSLGLDEILHTIMSKVAAFFRPERWSLMLVDESSGELYDAIVGNASGSTGRDPKSEGSRVTMGEGVAGRVAATGDSWVVPDVSFDRQRPGSSTEHAGLTVHSIACVPVRADGRTLGVVQLLNSQLDLTGELSLSFLRVLCDYAAIAIKNARSMDLIEDLTRTDDCTGLFNSRQLYASLDGLERRAGAEARGEFSLVFVDLDRFKSVNDTYGHLVGSAVLAEVGGLLKRSMRPTDSAHRYGGDEFVALLPGVGKEGGTATAVRMCQRLRDARFLEGRGLSLNVSGSFGVATFPEDGDSVHGILRLADKMMYEVKRSSRNNVAVSGRGLVMDAPLSGPRAIELYRAC